MITLGMRLGMLGPQYTITKFFKTKKKENKLRDKYKTLASIRCPALAFK